MTFCGQCGLQLSPGSTRCPRCGAIVEEPSMANGELHTDDPTIASQSILSQYQQARPAPNPHTPQPPLILRSTGTNNYDNDASSQTRGVDYTLPVSQNGYAPNSYNPTPSNGGPGTYQPPYNTNEPGGRTSYPPSNGNYPTQGTYPTNSAPVNYPTYNSQGNYPAPPMQTVDPHYTNGFPSQSMGYAQTPSSYQSPSSSLSARGKKIGMTLIIVGLAFILFAIILFALGQGLL
jgi:hypothetical protein